MGIKIKDSEDILLKGNHGNVEVDNSEGVIKNQEGEVSEFTNDSDFQILSSEFDRIEVQDSRVVLFETMAREILEVTDGENDFVTKSLQYFAHRIIESDDPQTKANGIKTLVNFAKANEEHLKKLGHLATLDWLRHLMGP